MTNKLWARGLLMLGVVALGACGKRLEGSMQVSSPLTINLKKEQVSLPAGTYLTVVQAGSRSAKVEMTTATGKVAFKLPAIPELKDRWGQGRIYLHGSQIGQNFDVDLNLDVSSSDSAPISRVERCVYDRREYQDWVCRNVRVPGRERCVKKSNGRMECTRDPDHWERQCNYETRTEIIYGQRNVRGYYSTLRRSGTFKFIQGSRTVAHLVDSNQTRTSWIQTRAGRCYR
jgi:hypothetical protein